MQMQFMKVKRLWYNVIYALILISQRIWTNLRDRISTTEIKLTLCIRACTSYEWPADSGFSISTFL